MAEQLMIPEPPAVFVLEDPEVVRAKFAKVAQFNADAWNNAHTIGTAVRYWLQSRIGPGQASRTSSEARVVSGHAVVSVVGHEGDVALFDVQPIGGVE